MNPCGQHENRRGLRENTIENSGRLRGKRRWPTPTQHCSKIIGANSHRADTVFLGYHGSGTYPMETSLAARTFDGNDGYASHGERMDPD